jgi:hypothetical protein
MADKVHPRVLARGTRSKAAEPAADGKLRVIVHAPQEPRAQWIEHELAGVDAVVQSGRNVEQVVAALIEDPPPRPQVLVVDFDTITQAELLHLHAVREHGWCGRIIGIGIVPAPLRTSLGIERVLNTPLVRDTLRDSIAEIGFHALTRRIPVLDDLSPAFTVRAQNVKVVTPRTTTRRR